ncbi:MAG TPA: cytochrome c biogenesis CcdA family protein [Methanocella sp.]|uniref:cytochrome c biogenesis CcdA family protein n=1 Tax=Methanocella sp. TaxID=2052833 RepID=UPI002CD97134|nr:cytochrome c biogenesis CcdA family protein [Methanocella sp.]HTY91086.1 cytochrome c biogenesis CcdA family protein [Methanocella sp.]
MEIVTFAGALLAGVVSIASPCVLPLLPGVMAYSTEKSKLTPLAIVFGLAASFTAMGVISSVFGAFLMDYMDYLKIASGVLIIFMGLYILSQTVEDFLLVIWQRLPFSRIARPDVDSEGFLGGALLGVSLGIVWMPCIGPMLASILTIVAQHGTIIYGGALLLTYSLGLAIPMLIVAYSSNLVSDKLRDISKYSMGIRKVAGVILLFVGVYYLSFMGFLPSLPLPSII